MAKPETGWTTLSEEPASDGPEWPAGVEIPTPELDEEMMVTADDTSKTAEPPAGTVSGSVPDPAVEAEDIGQRRRDQLKRNLKIHKVPTALNLQRLTNKNTVTDCNLYSS